MSELVHRYRHLGLSLAANVELDALAPGGSGPPDVRILVQRASAPPALDASWRMVDPPRPSWRQDTADGSRLRLRFAGTDGTWADFVLEADGQTVELTLSPDANITEAGELIAANVFSCLLAQRGWTCLHASVAAIEHRAVAFVGPKGAGKSTLASHLTRAGAVLLSDDVAAIRPAGGAWEVAVGRSLTRLTTDSAASVGTPFHKLDPVWDESRERPRKRFFDAGVSATQRCVELRAIVMLAPRRDDLRAELRRVSGQHLLPRLIANRHMAEVLDPAEHQRDFTRVGSLVVDLPVYELHRPDALAQLPAVVETTIRTLAAELTTD